MTQSPQQSATSQTSPASTRFHADSSPSLIEQQVDDTPTLRDWLHRTTLMLRCHQIASARLDAELLASFVLQHPRQWLHAHDDILLTKAQHKALQHLVARRCTHYPLAYLTQQKEFYRRDFYINSSVLVPRPETEMMIELLLQYARPHHRHLTDVGTGSGVVAITAKLEVPRLAVTACDIDPAALSVAQHNAASLHADITCQVSDLLGDAAHPYDIIMANLPYVDPDWRRDDRETAHEPQHALFAEAHGLALIYRLLEQTDRWLASHGLLILEADPCQHHAIIAEATRWQLQLLTTAGYAIALTKNLP